VARFRTSIGAPALRAPIIECDHTLAERIHFIRVCVNTKWGFLSARVPCAQIVHNRAFKFRVPIPSRLVERNTRGSVTSDLASAILCSRPGNFARLLIP